MALDNDGAADVHLAPAVRARLYRERAAALEAAIAETVLQRVQAKYREAADRFLALAEAEERLGSGEASPGAMTDEAAYAVLGPLLQFLRGDPTVRSDGERRARPAPKTPDATPPHQSRDGRTTGRI